MMVVGVKAIFFDLFETLVTEFSEGKRISERAYDYPRLLGLSHEQYKKEWRLRSQARMTGAFLDYPAVVKDILAGYGIDNKEEEIYYLYEERIKEKKIPFYQPQQEVMTMLAELKSRGFKLGLISNCTEEEVRLWDQCELAKYMDLVIFSYQAGLAKPDREIYKLACDQLQVEPAEALFVGDGGSSELEGAERAGLTPVHAVWFNTHISSNYIKLNKPAELLDLDFITSGVHHIK